MEHTPDNTRLQEKRDELIQLVADVIGENDKVMASQIVDSFCSLTPPQDPPVVMHFITMNSRGYDGGESRKPGNLRLNWRKFLVDFPDIGLNIAGVVATPYLVPLAALSLWNKIWGHSAIQLSKEHATVLYAMWQGRDTQNHIENSQAFEKSGVLFGVYQWPPLDNHAFESILAELERIECIECQDKTIWLREWVKTSYN
jgi:hypothetical protein